MKDDKNTSSALSASPKNAVKSSKPDGDIGSRALDQVISDTVNSGYAYDEDSMEMSGDALKKRYDKGVELDKKVDSYRDKQYQKMLKRTNGKPTSDDYVPYQKSIDDYSDKIHLKDYYDTYRRAAKNMKKKPNMFQAGSEKTF